MEARDVEPFPWHLGVFDAHCHPTDTMDHLSSIPEMKAKVLTVMATRAQDQELVAQAAVDMGVSESDVDNKPADWRKVQKLIPSFGWHPWFSHLLYDDTLYSHAPTLTPSQKLSHYQSVLTPSPPSASEGPSSFIHSLPSPLPLSHFLASLKINLHRFSLALVGEVGLDKSFRIPEDWLPEQAQTRDEGLTPGGREGRRLSPYRVSMAHQRRVLLAQLKVAGEFGRAVSCHGVQAHGVLYDALAETWRGCERKGKAASRRERKRDGAAVVPEDEAAREGVEPKPYPPRICLHSYSGPPEGVKRYVSLAIPVDIYFSFSSVVNFSTPAAGKTEEAIRVVPDDRILVESDLHMAGERMDGYLEEIVRKICEIKGWSLEDGVVQLGRNWKRFVFGVE